MEARKLFKRQASLEEEKSYLLRKLSGFSPFHYQYPENITFSGRALGAQNMENMSKIRQRETWFAQWSTLVIYGYQIRSRFHCLKCKVLHNLSPCIQTVYDHFSAEPLHQAFTLHLETFPSLRGWFNSLPSMKTFLILLRSQLLLFLLLKVLMWHLSLHHL